MGDLSYNLTTNKPTTHGLTAHSLLGHLLAFLKNHTAAPARTLARTITQGRE